MNVPPALLDALVYVESGYNPSAVSPAGAIGLAQLMPGTALELGVNPWNPEQNLFGGAVYLRRMYEKFGNWYDALRAYNAGPGKAASNPQAGASYATRVLWLAMNR